MTVFVEADLLLALARDDGPRARDSDPIGDALAVLADTSGDPPTRHTPLFRVKREPG